MHDDNGHSNGHSNGNGHSHTDRGFNPKPSLCFTPTRCMVELVTNSDHGRGSASFFRYIPWPGVPQVGQTVSQYEADPLIAVGLEVISTGIDLSGEEIALDVSLGTLDLSHIVHAEVVAGKEATPLDRDLFMDAVYAMLEEGWSLDLDAVWKERAIGEIETYPPDYFDDVEEYDDDDE